MAPEWARMENRTASFPSSVPHAGRRETRAGGFRAVVAAISIAGPNGQLTGSAEGALLLHPILQKPEKRNLE